MARQLDGVDDKVETTTLPSTAVDDITMGGWFYYDSLATDAEVCLYNGNNASNGYGLYRPAGGNMDLLLGGVAIAGIGGAISASVWTHLVLRRSGGTWQIYKDGATLGSTIGTAPNAPSGGGFTVGDSAQRDAFNLQKRAAEVFFAGAAISTNTIAALAGGALPSDAIAKEDLLLYWPLWGDASPEPNLVAGGTSGTVTGATKVNHAPVSLFDLELNWSAPLIEVAAGGDAVPQCWQQYRSRRAA